VKWYLNFKSLIVQDFDALFVRVAFVNWLLKCSRSLIVQDFDALHCF